MSPSPARGVKLFQVPASDALSEPHGLFVTATIGPENYISPERFDALQRRGVQSSEIRLVWRPRRAPWKLNLHRYSQ